MNKVKREKILESIFLVKTYTVFFMIKTFLLKTEGLQNMITAQCQFSTTDIVIVRVQFKLF